VPNARIAISRMMARALFILNLRLGKRVGGRLQGALY
jgi:hypothetical protein